jgi:uroporphyrinogen-III decarboxylase
MTDQDWKALLAVLRGATPHPLPTGFIVDSPWLPGWAGHTILDYFTDEAAFFDDNVKVHEAFPGSLFLPGFWSEYGMCTEPSAFGAVQVWGEDEFPSAMKVLRSPADIDLMAPPDPRRHGLLPFVIKRLKHLEPRMLAAGHRVRFAVARGPLNIASFLMGTTEFLTALRTDPEPAHRLLGLVTDFLVDWIAWQRECFPSIDGLLILDDIVGFVGPRDFDTFALPYLERTFKLDVSVRFFHNDAPCKTCAPYLPGIGVNMLNFGIQHTLNDMRHWTEGRVTLVGNIPPRDVLAVGTPEDVTRCVREMLESVEDRSRLIVSCAGGMPPGVTTANIEALIEAVEGFGD